MSLEIIKDFSKKINLDFQDKGDGIFQLWMKNSYAFIEFIHVYTYFNQNYPKDSFDDINKNEYFISFKIIFRSWHVSNDRTDFNDIIPVLVATLLRLLAKSSFKIIDIEHPVIEDELYGRELIPIQGIDSNVDFTNTNQLSQLEELLVEFSILNNMLFTFFNCSDNIKDEYSSSNTELDEWIERILKTVKTEKFTIYNSRTNPKWLYFKDADISIVKNKSIVDVIYHISLDNKIEVVDGINGRLFIEGDIKNIIYFKQCDNAKKIFQTLENSNSDLLMIPLDNISIFAGKEHILFLKNDGKFDNFVKEKELVRQRHFQESNILFRDVALEIVIDSKQDSEIFEDLILELLKREDFIFRAKKVAPTNQPDNGRDIICKFNAKYENQTFKKDEKELDYKKLIVQCKTNLTSSKKQSIGKSNVDIADTIFDYKPDGYMVITNTQLTTRLTEYLEKIEERENIYIDWWNREDIEERLLKYPELIHKFSKIIKQSINIDRERP